MRTALVLLIVVALGACGAKPPSAEQELLAHAWSPTAADCKDKFAKFTRTSIEFHLPSRPVSSLKVLRIVNAPDHPENVMVVFEPGDVQSRSDADLGAFLFDLSGERLKLVAQGSPVRLMRVTPDSPNARNFDLTSCG